MRLLVAVHSGQDWQLLVWLFLQPRMIVSTYPAAAASPALSFEMPIVGTVLILVSPDP